MAFLAGQMRRYTRLNALTEVQLAIQLGVSGNALFRLMGEVVPASDAEIARLVAIYGIDQAQFAKVIGG